MTEYHTLAPLQRLHLHRLYINDGGIRFINHGEDAPTNWTPMPYS